MDFQGSSGDFAKASVTLSLYENALDSIRHALEHYTTDLNPNRRYKYCLLHLSQGVSLLLKERLSREHPNFIYINVADTDKTVDNEQAIQRLEKIAKVDLTYARPLLKTLNQLRNSIEHYSVSVAKPQAASVIAQTVVFLTTFFSDEFHSEFKREIGEETWKSLVGINEYFTHAQTEAENRIRSSGQDAFSCESCQSPTATVTETHPDKPNKWELNYQKITCLVCGTWYIRYECRGCGKERFTDYPTGAVHGSYCETCSGTCRERYPDSYIATYLEEVRRWFEEHDTITAGDAHMLRANVIMAGPTSAFAYPKRLVEEGYLEFAYDHDRESWEISKRERPNGWLSLPDHVVLIKTAKLTPGAVPEG